MASAEPSRRDQAFALLESLVRDPAPEPLFALLRGSVGAGPARDPRAAADRIRLALHDWLAASARRRPQALLLEDLHWADAASWTALEQVLDRLEGAPVLVLATSREETVPSLEGRDAVRIHLGGLPAHEVAALAEAVAGKPLDVALVRALAERTQGNPLFVRQITHALVEAGALDRGEVDLPLPVTVEAAIQARLERLPPELRAACERASVLGPRFSVDALEALGVERAAEAAAALGVRDLFVSRARARPDEAAHGFRTGRGSSAAPRPTRR